MREKPLVGQVSEILARIAMGSEIPAALVEDAVALDRELDGERQSEHAQLSRAIVASTSKLSVLTDKLASGVLNDDIYREKAAELKSSWFATAA